MSDFKITDKVDIRALNPYDVKLGNEYLDNLLATGFAIVSRMHALVGVELELVKAFVPIGKIKTDLKDEANAYDRKYSHGLALSFTWPSFLETIALRTAMELYDQYHEAGLHIVVDPFAKTLSVYRKMKDRKVFIVTDPTGKKKMIR